MTRQASRTACSPIRQPLPLKPLVWQLALASGAFWAQQAMAMHELPAVVVTAVAEPESAFSVSPAQALEELGKTAGAVGVVDANDYLNGRASTMEDTLKLATGVFAQSRFGAEEARVSIRGSGLQRTFHGRGLMVLQDGVPLNLADGSYDMQAIEPFATRYIEVQRGANALRYGGSTLGGAINYVGLTGLSAPPLLLRAEAGSFGYRRYQLASGGVSGKVDGYASLSQFEQDGYRDHAVQRTGRFFGNAGVQLSPAVESRFYLTAVDSDSELPGNRTRAQLSSAPRGADAGSLKRDTHRDFALYRLANRTAIQGEHGAVTEVTSYVSKKILFHPLSFARVEQDSRDVGIGLSRLQPTHWLGSEQDQVLGVNWRRGLTLDEQCDYGAAAAGTHPCTKLVKQNKLSADNIEVYGESQWHVTPTTTVSAGAQWTAAMRRVTPVQVLTSTGTLYQETYTRVSPKFGVLHELRPGMQVFANVSGSFEPPSFSEGPVAGKPLRAQRGMTAEIGTRGDMALADTTLLTWDLALYRAHLRNELLAITPPGLPAATQNADKTLHQGVEAGLRAEGNGWRGQASYLFNDFRFRRSGDAAIADGNDIAGMPRQTLALETALRLPRDIWFGPVLRAASRSYVDHANTLAAAGYAIYGLKLNQHLDRGLDWFVEGRNLADKRYAATTGVIRNAAGVDQSQFSPGDGRGVYVGISQSF